MTTDVVTLRPEQTVQEAADVLAGRGHRGGTGGRRRRRVVGLLRDEDLIVSEARLHVPTVITFLGADLVWPTVAAPASSTSSPRLPARPSAT